MTDNDINPSIAEIPQDLALIKVENDTMMAAAAARPRDLKAVSKYLTDQIRAFPSFARTVLYSRPVGKDEGGQMKFATGLSIRAAEALAEAYGFNRVWSQIRIDPDSGNATVSASFTDFQRVKTTSASILVSRTYKTRYGEMRQHPEDRFLDVVCKAAQSKVIRDVIVRSIPPALKTELELAVRGANRLDEKAVAKIVAYFEKKGVALAELEEMLGAASGEWIEEHRQRLLEVTAAIEDGETTIADVFGERRKAAPEGGVTDSPSPLEQPELISQEDA